MPTLSGQPLLAELQNICNSLIAVKNVVSTLAATTQFLQRPECHYIYGPQRGMATTFHSLRAAIYPLREYLWWSWTRCPEGLTGTEGLSREQQSAYLSLKTAVETALKVDEILEQYDFGGAINQRQLVEDLQEVDMAIDWERFGWRGWSVFRDGEGSDVQAWGGRLSQSLIGLGGAGR